MKFKYNYVFFNVGAIKNHKEDKDSYYYICTEDLCKMDNVHVVSYPLDYSSYFLHLLFTLHSHPKINKIVNMPLKNLWYPYYFKVKFPENRPFCFVVYGYYITVGYLNYLKKRYPDCRIVLIHRDLISLWRKRQPEFTDENIKALFDLIMTYDEDEAAKYGISYFSEIESKTEVPIAKNYPTSDVFFAGSSKGRLNMLLQIYDVLIGNGLTCHYYITDVPKGERIQRPGITYAEHNMPYREMLYHTVNSRCVLEINQPGAVGYTSRFLEAVMYNKKLMTNNIAIKKSNFFNPKYIQCFSTVSAINASFVMADVGEINYHYNGEFSPVWLIEQIERELTSK